MDIDGIVLLIDGDRDRYLQWKEDSKHFSLKELKKSYEEWLGRYNDAFEKYKNLQTGDTLKDAPLMCAKLMYFHDLSEFTLHALMAYNEKLQKEYDLLKVPSKPRTKASKKPLKKDN